MVDQQIRSADPYALDASFVREPPTSFLGKLRYIGPGFILSASIVGSGELIATTILGAQAGFDLLEQILAISGFEGIQHLHHAGAVFLYRGIGSQSFGLPH